ncbi:MBL fold metallo-hydrolase [Photobacterium aquimaris]|uniref:MBL fold metallo-hydrolase n=1 Tax=Photobacterium aquimaris TaxID=512643 RepID=A0A2T3HXI7_9GAMM|nr:MBL fold metallo-hydrolase [Photobacterium aquimaris]OBU24936.1 MBL fold hydrolase [Photobacterium aquimaris]PQJ42184.1 MBL fold hydrolase [Photobacterium aquimaris]PSU04142.1 MBL fold metallo-hydrolase [Photobacterium aquimaris]
MNIVHHGAKTGVTGSCHELVIGDNSLLIDCGLFQGIEARETLDIEFDINNIAALLLTHSHIDHIGRLPWLLAAGFTGPIYATEATAALVPLMLEDGLKLQLGLNKKQCEKALALIHQRIRPVPYDCWAQIVLPTGDQVKIRFRPAGHILGSAYIEIKLPTNEIVVFSGDLGPKNTPLLADPIAPTVADTLVIESTYGDKPNHQLEHRQQVLKRIIERSLQDGGAIVIPAFSVGRTQELLFDLENIIAQIDIDPNETETNKRVWKSLPVILDSPLAQKVTEQYRYFHELWAKEAKHRRYMGRHPLAFEQCITIDSHADHIKLVNRLQHSGEPAIIVAASGMCSGGRVVNYLKALLADKRTDIIFAGYQAQGTTGRALVDGDRAIKIDDKVIDVMAHIHQLSGYSAHAAQSDLVSFVADIEQGPKIIKVVHGDLKAQTALAVELRKVKPEATVIIAASE